MATTKIRSSSIEDGQVSNADLSATVAVTGGQIADDAVTTAKILDDNVTTAKILDNNVTLAKMADGTQGDTLYYGASGAPTLLAKPGTPADEVLTFATSATAPSWVAPAAGGLTAASQWRLTTDFTGNAEPIASNLEEVDTIGAGVLGTSMAESSGIFTFPSSGYWYVGFGTTWIVAGDIYVTLMIRTTTNDSTYAIATRTNQRGYYNQCCAYNDYIVDVTDTTQCKVGFGITVGGTPSSVTTRGSSSENQTWMTFLRLADT